MKQSALADDHAIGLSTPTLLVVDDDPVNLHTLVDVLDGDYRVLVAKSGKQALRLLDKHGRIHLMLLDVDMPGMSGFDVLVNVRQHAVHADLPVILVTGRNQQQDEAFGLEQGASDYLTKPISAAVVRARVKTQLKLAQAKIDLEAKNNQLQRALEEIKAAKDELAEFTAMVSHELRTPVAILLCETELLVAGVRQPSLTNLESLHDELKHFSGLINDLFNLVLAETGSLNYCKQACVLSQLVERSMQRFALQFQEAGIHLKPDLHDLGSLSVYADPNRMRQVFDNLLKNTLRYTDAGGELQIRAGLARDGLFIDFQDSSPGVDSEDLGRLFDRLYRGEKSRNRATGGAGMGLAVCKTIIADHGGIITAQASPIGGLWVRIELPAEPGIIVAEGTNEPLDPYR